MSADFDVIAQFGEGFAGHQSFRQFLGKRKHDLVPVRIAVDPVDGNRSLHDHAAGHGVIGIRIDQDERARVAIGLVGVEHGGFIEIKMNRTDRIQR